MEKFLGLIIIVLFLVIGVAVAGTYLLGSAERHTQAQAHLEYARGQARAVVIEAQGQARLDSAQAWAVTSAAALPWGVLAIVGLLGLGVVALALVIVARPVVNHLSAGPQITHQLPPVQNNYYLLLPEQAEVKRLIDRKS